MPESFGNPFTRIEGVSNRFRTFWEVLGGFEKILGFWWSLEILEMLQMFFMAFQGISRNFRDVSSFLGGGSLEKP